MNIATLQISSLPISESKLDYYLRICHSKGVKILLLGEYVLNLFFKELEKTPLEMIKEQSEMQIEILQEFADSYNITIVAPIIRISKKSTLKTIAKIKPRSKISYYNQQFLMPFKHWNEKAFFSNTIETTETIKAPMIFTEEGIKFAALFGYELHFDELWLEIKRKKVDCVLLPTVSTFDSNERWREIIKSRAFLNSCYILRGNRIGEYMDEHYIWRFYGDSLFCRPDGNIENSLSDKEELLIGEIDKETIKDIRKNWSFSLSLK